MKHAVIAGLVLALAISASAIPADKNPFGIKQGWGWVWVPPPPPVTDAPTTAAPVTDAPTDATTTEASTDATTTEASTDATTTEASTDATTTATPVTQAPVTLPPGTTICIPVTGTTDTCDSTLLSLIDWLVPYLINAISTLLTKQGRIPSVLLITELLVQFILCLINALIGAGYPVVDALIAVLASRS